MGNLPLSRHDLNVSPKGFKIESPQIFNMQILIMIKIFGLRFLMIFAVSSLANEIVEMFFVLLKESVGSLIVFN